MSRPRLSWVLYRSFLAVLLLALLFVGLYTTVSFRRFFMEATGEDLLERARLIAGPVREMLLQPDRFPPPVIDRRLKELGASRPTRLTLIRPDGTVAGDSLEDPGRMENHGTRPEVRRALAGEAGIDSRFSATLRQPMLYAAIPLRDEAGRTVAALRAAVSIASLDGALRLLWLRVLAGGLAVLAAAGGAALWLSRRISAPLEILRRGAERFSRGDLEARLPAPESAEMAALTEALNGMAVQLRERIGLLERQRAQEATILASMDEGLLAVDRRRIVIAMNGAAFGLLRLPGQEARGRRVEEVVSSPTLLRFVLEALESAEPRQEDLVLREGVEERILQAYGTALRGPTAEWSGALVVLRDITRLSRLETVRRDFAANVSHELRTPLTAIKGFVETLLDGALEDPQRARHFLRIIDRQTERLVAIVEELLDLARLEQGSERRGFELRPGGVAEVVREAVAVCAAKAEEKRIALQAELAEDARAALSPQLLEQAVINLLDNAIKYSDPGGEVRVRVRRQEGEARIEVQDHGCGIDAEHLPRLFERFYRVDRARSRALGGTGLGLAIVKHIALAHGGRAEVESEPGKGSTFSIVLPANAREGDP